MKKLLSIILSITMLLSMGTVAFADGIDGPMQKAKLTVGINAEFHHLNTTRAKKSKALTLT